MVLEGQFFRSFPYKYEKRPQQFDGEKHTGYIG
jgi:hypothetical protein